MEFDVWVINTLAKQDHFTHSDLDRFYRNVALDGDYGDDQTVELLFLNLDQLSEFLELTHEAIDHTVTVALNDTQDGDYNVMVICQFPKTQEQAMIRQFITNYVDRFEQQFLWEIADNGRRTRS